jgi:hypothetical protein
MLSDLDFPIPGYRTIMRGEYEINDKRQRADSPIYLAAGGR